MRVESVQELLEHWETLVDRLQQENVVLRAQRDEARYALSLVGHPNVEKSVVGPRMPRRYVRVSDEDIASVEHLSIRKAAEALGVSTTTVMTKRRMLEAQREPLKIVRTGT